MEKSILEQFNSYLAGHLIIQTIQDFEDNELSITIDVAFARDMTEAEVEENKKDPVFSKLLGI
jgi:hypothetical protein